MMRISASKAREDLSEVLNRVAYSGERVRLHRRGKDVAVLISVEDFSLLEGLEDMRDVAEARAALKEFEESGEASSARGVHVPTTG